MATVEFDMNGVAAVIFPIVIWLLVMSGMSYGHYGMILIPAVIYPISLAFSDIEKIKEEGPKRALFVVVSLYLISAVIVPKWMPAVEGLPLVYENRKENQRSEITETIMEEYIEDLGKELPKVIVVASGRYDKKIQEFLKANHYVMQYASNNENLLHSMILFVKE